MYNRPVIFSSLPLFKYLDTGLRPVNQTLRALLICEVARELREKLRGVCTSASVVGKLFVLVAHALPISDVSVRDLLL